MESIPYIERTTGKTETEKVYGEKALRFLYGVDSKLRFLAAPLLQIVSKTPLISALYGWCQKQTFSRRKIAPFIENFHVDPSEFEHDPSTYSSFNDFFIRTLKLEARPIAPGKDVAVIPADGRYRFFQNVSKVDGFLVKGQKFSFDQLLEDKKLAEQYQSGTMVMARLCPTDYHRFHFPCDCVPGNPRLINGYLYSVNPIALRRNIHIFTENKRMITELETESFGKVLFIEVGATNVGTIHQTFSPGKRYRKGEEKGYFSFGGSALIILFEEGKLSLAQDLLDLSKENLEIRCQMGQALNK